LADSWWLNIVGIIGRRLLLGVSIYSMNAQLSATSQRPSANS